MVYRKLLIFLLSLIVCCIGGVSAYAEENSDSLNGKFIKFKATIPEDIVFENEISVQLENIDSGDAAAYAITSENSYVSQYSISNGKYRITSARVTGEYEGEFKCDYSEEPFEINSNSEKVTEIPLKIQFISNGNVKESASASLAGTDTDSNLSDSSDSAVEPEHAVYRHKKNHLASLCITLGLLSCLGAGYFIYKARNESI